MATFSIPNIPTSGYIPAIKQISDADSVYRLTDAPTIDAAKKLGFEEYRANAPWAGNTAILSQKISDKVASLPDELVGETVTATIRSAEVLSDVGDGKITASGVLSAISSGNAIGYIANAIGYNIGKKSAEVVNDFWESVQEKVFGKKGKLLENADAPVIVKNGKPYVNERMIRAVRDAFFELDADITAINFPPPPVGAVSINKWGNIHDLFRYLGVEDIIQTHNMGNTQYQSALEKLRKIDYQGSVIPTVWYENGKKILTLEIKVGKPTMPLPYITTPKLVSYPGRYDYYEVVSGDNNHLIISDYVSGSINIVEGSTRIGGTLTEGTGNLTGLIVYGQGTPAYDPTSDVAGTYAPMGTVAVTDVPKYDTITPTSGVGTKDQTIADAYPDWRAKALGFPANVGTEEKEYWYPLTIPNAIPAISGLDDTQEKAWAGEMTDTITPTKEEVLDNIGVVAIPNAVVTPIPVPNPEPPLIPTPPAVSDISVDIGLCSLYNPSLSQVKEFSRWLWGADFNIDQFKKLFQDPMQAIIGLHVIYATPVTGAQSGIQVGYINSGVNAAVVTKQYTEIDCGTIALNERFGDLRDYSPYTQVSLYLPFVGIVEINTDDVMRASISIKYKIDVLTGTCLALVNVKRNDVDGVLYSYSGNCGVQYPITAGSYLGTIGSLISMVATGAATYASGGALAPLAIGAAANALSGGAKANTSMSGTLSSNAGAMGIRKPYIIIKRVEPADADRYSEYYGYTTNKLVKLSQVTGYVRVKDINLSGTNATEDEQNEIITLLKEGVIL